MYFHRIEGVEFMCYSHGQTFLSTLYARSDDCATLLSVIHQVLTGECTNHRTNANCRAIATFQRYVLYGAMNYTRGHRRGKEK